MVKVKSLLARNNVRNILIVVVVLLVIGIALLAGGAGTRDILSGIFAILVTPEFVKAALMASAPLLIAGLGGLISELSGVLNMALESMMLIGAFVAYTVSDHAHSPWAGLAAAALAGMTVGLIHAFFTITLRSNQIVSAVALNLFALAVTSLGFRVIYANEAFIFAPGFNALHFPVLSDLPYLGVAFFQHNIIIYLALLLIPTVWFIVYKTSWGLTLRSVGEHPMAASTVGINVNRVRYLAVLISGAIVGMSGSALISASNLNAFQENISAGRGFIAFAAVVFGRWNPIGIFLGTILFGLGDALQIRLQAYGVQVPYQLLEMLPYLITLFALVVFMRNARGPAASGTPFIEEE
ncbi:MAG: ABC transporter permease [Anaerolineaceae bacterium]|nr:ABC transporter permease [Anaerolineaceae bacterium]